ncbi:hypothetical protein OG728_37915 [Streptomyces microflavus]|uniref:hypothetical protein n=1 Tax=Streptomyces microflavus TaxID=1919 RepID=UPI002E11FF5C|nr:hypothetical protein OG728_00130 [Streptomyces microflavus]WSR95831.1 hypothetical protein OG728_37915 [Streptomyces microflavus]
MALTGPQMLGQGVMPSMPGEMRQGLGSGTPHGRMAGRALRAVEHGPALLGA